MIGATLHDGEKRLAVPVKPLGRVKALPSAFQPAVGEPERLLGIIIIGFPRRTLVKRHHYVGADYTLYVHHLFRSEKMFRPVNVAAEISALLLELAVG